MVAWNEMLDEFRALGGTADNLCLNEGALGRGLFPENPARPILLHVPDSLLFDADHIVFDNGNLCAGPKSNADDRTKAWFETYEREFSWGGGGRGEVERFVEAMRALPEDLRNVLATKFGFSLCIEDDSPDVVQNRFLDSRVIHYGGRKVVMPIVELANHGHLAKYDCNDGVSIRGRFTGEVLVDYLGLDAWGLFLTWSFASEEPMAISIPLTLKAAFGEFVVARKPDKGRLLEVESLGQIRLPECTIEGDRVTLSFLMLGMKGTPRVPRGIVHRVFRDAGLSGADEVFDLIQHQNRMQFLSLLALLERLEGPMVRSLREMSRLQLQAMSSHYGSREF